jgi:hypothetical protein
MFSKAVNKGLSIEDVVFDDYPNFMDDVPDLLRLHGLFVANKCKHALVDYDDLLVYMRDLLQGHGDIRERLSETYQFIMVDEYQDTNKIQADIVQLLAHSHNNVMVVGDDSQSIYAFRGANFRNIMDFPRLFAGTRIIKLEENYRSTQPILDLTNIIIDRANKKFTKVLFTRKKGGALPALVMAKGERMQSQFVVQRILELREEGIPLDDIAVLFRSGFHSFDLEIELNRANVPFVKVGGFKFMETAHIKDVLAHMKVLANPNDSVSWHRILLLLDAIGPKAAEDIFQWVATSGKGIKGMATHHSKPRYAAGFERLRGTLESLDPNRVTVAEIGSRLGNGQRIWNIFYLSWNGTRILTNFSPIWPWNPQMPAWTTFWPPTMMTKSWFFQPFTQPKGWNGIRFLFSGLLRAVFLQSTLRGVNKRWKKSFASCMWLPPEQRRTSISAIPPISTTGAQPWCFPGLPDLSMGFPRIFSNPGLWQTNTMTSTYRGNSRYMVIA